MLQAVVEVPRAHAYSLTDLVAVLTLGLLPGTLTLSCSVLRLLSRVTVASPGQLSSLATGFTILWLLARVLVAFPTLASSFSIFLLISRMQTALICYSQLAFSMKPVVTLASSQSILWLQIGRASCRERV